jgi:hypothetical protein
VVEAVELKEGDEIEITVAGKRNFAIHCDRQRERALEVLRSSQWKFLAGWKFDSRGGQPSGSRRSNRRPAARWMSRENVFRH